MDNIITTDHLISTPIPDSHSKNEAGETIRRNVFMMDGTMVPQAPYVAATWYSSEDHPTQDPHTHDFDEFLAFLGTDPENPEDLGLTVRMRYGEGWLEITKSCVLFVPAGTKHSIFAIENVRRPMLSVASCAAQQYVKEENGVTHTIGTDGVV